MFEKQDRIIEILKERTVKLEDEVRITKEHLATTLKEKNELLGEIEGLRIEAHEVVGQWEKAVADLRAKLELANANVATSEKLLEKSYTDKNKLEERVVALEKCTSTYSLLITDLQTKLSDTENSRNDILASLDASRKECLEISKQVKHYEEMSANIHEKMNVLIESEKAYLSELADAREALSSALKENAAFRAQNDETKALLEHINESDSLLKQLSDNLDARDRQLGALQIDHENILLLLREREAQISQLESDIFVLKASRVELSAQYSALEKKNAESEFTLQKQLEVISAYENDIEELHDSRIAHEKLITDLQGQVIQLGEQLETAVKLKDELETQFGTLKECYSTLLMESSEAKVRNDAVVCELKMELKSIEDVSREKITSTERKYEDVLRSVRELSTSFYHVPIRDCLTMEQVGRCEIELTMLQQLANAQDLFTKYVAAEMHKAQTCLAKSRLDLAFLQTERKHQHTEIQFLEKRLKTAEGDLNEHRKACSGLEQELSTFKTLVKELEKKNATIEADNSWLKAQVESMRHELSDLDELLNTNLNEMREENEKLQQHSLFLQQSLDLLSESKKNAEERAGYATRELGAQKDEFMVQAKALSILETDLLLSNENVEKLKGVIKDTLAQLEEQRKEKAELVSSNAVLLSKAEALAEQLRTIELKNTLFMTDKEKEVETLKAKVNEYDKLFKKYKLDFETQQAKYTSSKQSVHILKEDMARAKSVMGQMKERYEQDNVAIKHLLAGRNDLLQERNDAIERYNQLYDATRNAWKETPSKMSEELQKVIKLATTQEKELQQLRSENLVLKKSVSMFVTSAQPKAETIFTERLNLVEGPLRYPKKRSVTKESE